MGIDYLAPSPLSPPSGGDVSTPVPPGPPMGTPLPGAPAPAARPPMRPNPAALAAVASLLGAGGRPGGAPPGPNGIPGAQGAGAPPYPVQPSPATMKYTNETQQDGTVLLRILNPDGSPGPVVHIIKPPAMKGKK